MKEVTSAMSFVIDAGVTSQYWLPDLKIRFKTYFTTSLLGDVDFKGAHVSFFFFVYLVQFSTRMKCCRCCCTFSDMLDVFGSDAMWRCEFTLSTTYSDSCEGVTKARVDGISIRAYWFLKCKEINPMKKKNHRDQKIFYILQQNSGE